jgi:hypothetical protein
MSESPLESGEKREERREKREERREKRVAGCVTIGAKCTGSVMHSAKCTKRGMAIREPECSCRAGAF